MVAWAEWGVWTTEPPQSEQRPGIFPGPFSCAADNALGETVASDDKKIKPDAAPKTNAPSNDGSTTKDAAPPKADGGERAADSSSGYSRGEGQKPVTNAYRENWNAIFGKKKKR